MSDLHNTFTPEQHHYYAVINTLWDRAPIADLLSDIKDTGGDPDAVGLVYLLAHPETFDKEYAHALVTRYRAHHHGGSADMPLSTFTAIIDGVNVEDMPGVEVAFDHPAGGSETRYQRKIADGGVPVSFFSAH